MREDAADTPKSKGAPEHPPPSGPLASKARLIVESGYYEPFMAIVVMCNAISIGIQIDHPTYMTVGQWLAFGVIFFSIFLVEVIVKMIAYGMREYFHDWWNTFDFVVTVMAAMELAASFAFLDERINTTWSKYVSGEFIQMLRLFRLLRMARIFKELGVLCQSFILSVQAMSWILVLSFLWFFLCACVATVFIGRKDWLPNVDNDGVSAEEIAEVRSRFASIPMSMFALFEIMTLEGWIDYVRPLLNSRADMVIFFLFFIFISAFFLLNLITAVVVDRTLEAQQQQNQQDEETDERKDAMAITDIADRLRSLNEDNDIIQLKDFMTYISDDPKIKSNMEFLNWSEDYMVSMYTLIDHDNDEEAPISRLQALWLACTEPLDTTNYVKFQVNLARRMEYSEKVSMTMFHALESYFGKKFEVHEDIKGKTSFLKNH
eukprot:gnl/MRDRNA2_/MRDRNA2_34818_c0_seq1.p1 gnl/MRDRNA2_/MRDRNA2_34818_c0~~gnl/MRDRNA2_/MRDRNA2_34818_c0_seq1.p1  ORF type:complete len:433 (+),score=70.25 gnl/MRDRNA2_/MRDRNA2_34818_c0_seq1:120-1418(+)